MESTDVRADLPEAMRSDEPRPPSGRRVAHAVLWGVLGLALAGVGVAAFVPALSSLLAGNGAEVPTVYGIVPDFALTDRSGRTVTAADLEGDVWVANFIFTRCAGMCPGLSTRMAMLQRTLQGRADAAGTRLVSFTVDPTRDTPEVLRGYAERLGADPQRWLFLTGPREAIHRLVGDGFKLSIAEAPPGSAVDRDEPITHSDRFVIVDSSRRIRGYVHGSDESAVPELMRRITALRREAG